MQHVHLGHPDKAWELDLDWEWDMDLVMGTEPVSDMGWGLDMD
jgi:hypothetical protein